MGLPEQVRKQSEAVQKLYEELNGPSEEASAPDTEPASDPAQQPEPEARQQQEPQQGESEPQEQVSEDWEHKYKTLQGMFNREMERANQSRQQMQQRMGQLEQLLATTQQQKEETQSAPEPKRYVTEEDVSEYGDSIDVMRRVSREESQQLINYIQKLEQELKSVKQLAPRVEQVAQSQAKSAEQLFWDRLNVTVPNWREINNDPKFQEWLMQVDPFTGLSKQAYLEDAQQNLDVQRVSQFFNAWSAETGGGVQNKSGIQNRTTSELQRQVAPGRSRNTGAPATTNEKPTYSRADIKKFFEDVRQGKYEKNPEERNRIERDIFAAQADGRIT